MRCSRNAGAIDAMDDTRADADPAGLLIGYGNPLRRDDGAGATVARAVQRRQVPGLRVLVVQQLTPELAEGIAQARFVVFVDARAAAPTESAARTALQPEDEPPTLGHKSDPRHLLALARVLCGSCPPAWLVTVPGRDFGLGQGLSRTARRGVAAALDEIARLVEGLLDAGKRTVVRGPGRRRGWPRSHT